MRQQFQTPPQEDQVTGHVPVLNLNDNRAVFEHRRELKAKADALYKALKDLDEEIIKPAIEAAEEFTDGTWELRLEPGVSQNFDWKRAMAEGAISEEMLRKYLSTTPFKKLVNRKVAAAKSPEPGSTEDVELRKRIANASKGLVG